MKKEDLSFLFEGNEIILIKYCILFLATCYSQLEFILVYYSCKKKKVWAYPIKHGFLVIK